jgi:ribosomal protein S27E
MRSAAISRRFVALHTLGIVIVATAFMTPGTANAMSNDIITSAGQSIASIFEGLAPSRYVLEYRDKKPRRTSRPWEERLERGKLLDEGTAVQRFGPRLLRVDCGTCPPDTVCSGHYEKIVACSGCCVDPLGCGQVNNFQQDTQHEAYDSGVYDTYCGLDCCWDAQPCTNP